MSKSYHKHYNYATGKNTEYYRACARTLRSKHNQMIRNLIHVCSPEELNDLLYHIPKKAIYDLWGAPADYRYSVAKANYHELDDDCPFNDVNSNICWRREKLIVRARLKGYPKYNRKKYPYKDLLAAV